MKKMAGYGPVTEIEFLRKNNNRAVNRQKKIRTIKIRSLHVVLIISLFLISGYAAYSVGKFMTGWEKLDIRSFQLINTPAFKNNRMKQIIKKYGGNILTLNTTKLREELLGIKEIEDVSISRKLPSIVEVRLKLRQPSFQFLYKGKYNIIDKSGIILSENVKKLAGVLVIRDITPSDLDDIFPGLSGLIDKRDIIEYISFKEPYGTALKLKGTSEIFYTGNEIDLEKLRTYLKIRKQLGYTESAIKSVDLRFRDRFYLEFEKEII
ncbi:MAG: FtsQ-type POTRA domain-containing protein [Acidobacteriota bacterium]